jgi:hypothetical protein
MAYVILYSVLSVLRIRLGDQRGTGIRGRSEALRKGKPRPRKIASAYDAFWFLIDHPKLNCRQAVLLTTGRVQDGETEDRGTVAPLIHGRQAGSSVQ